MAEGKWGRRGYGREEVIAALLCLAVTPAGSQCTGPLGDWSLEQKAAPGADCTFPASLVLCPRLQPGPQASHHCRPPEGLPACPGSLGSLLPGGKEK